MYHPAEVKTIIKKSGKVAETHATIVTWDENLFTFKVSTEIENEIKKGDIVLVDYRPIESPPHVPRLIICKILDSKEGKEVMDEYKKYHKDKKQTVQGPQNPVPIQYPQIPGIG